MSSKFDQIRPWTTEFASLERLKKIPYTYNGENDVITFSLLFFIGPLSYLQVKMTHIRPWMSSYFDQIRPRTTELAPLERLNNLCRHFFSFAIDQINVQFVVNEECMISNV